MLIEQGEYTPIHALSITNEDIVEYLDGLPEQKIHCSVMGAEALEAAVFNWAQRRGVDLARLGVDIHADEQEEGRIVCKCFSLSEPYIRRKIKELNLRTIPDVTGAIKAGGACMSCHHTPGGLQDLLDEVWNEAEQGSGLRVLTNPIAHLTCSFAGKSDGHHGPKGNSLGQKGQVAGYQRAGFTGPGPGSHQYFTFFSFQDSALLGTVFKSGSENWM